MNLHLKSLAVGVVTAATLGGTVCAQNNVVSDTVLNERISRQVEHLNRVYQSPLEVYQEKISHLQDPQGENLLPILRELIPYNEVFAGSQPSSVKHALAKNLNAPVIVPWNTYRGNGLIEIFDKYVPENHGDKDLADLEFYVKKYTLSAEDIRSGQRLLEALPAEFAQAYTRLDIFLGRMSQKDPKTIVALLAGLAEEYNKLYEDNHALAVQLYKAFFKFPLRTGWNKTTSVDELRLSYGALFLGGGDYVQILSESELMQRYGITDKEAHAFYTFCKNYYQ